MQELPTKYYHDNFEYLLDFVKNKYGNLLLEKEWHFLRKYYSLPLDAQCLFIRLVNRKGLFFKVSTINYDEIEDQEKHLKLLKDREFVSDVNFSAQKLWLNDLLSTLTKPELLKIFIIQDSKGLKKENLLQAIKDIYTVEEIFRLIQKEEQLIKVNFEIEVSFLMFLFFGNRSMDMTEFVLRDLGLVHYHKQDQDDLVARFSTRKEAEDKWQVSELFGIFSEIKDTISPEEIFDWYCNFRDTHLNLSPIAIPSFQKLQLLIGKHLERFKLYPQAIEIYTDTVVPPARERKARSLVKAKYFEEAKNICEEMILSPYNIDEQYFAEYFLTTLSNKKNKKQTTQWLNEAEEIILSSDYKKQVELGSLAYFFELGHDGGFSENFTWRALFGLIFWDIIFDPRVISFHHPFQRRPSDLYLPEFYKKRKAQIEQRLEAITDSDVLIEELWKKYEETHGTANPFVLWEPEIWRLVKVLVSRINLIALKKVLLLMAENLVENSRGMPDLLIWNESTFELIEVKSPNDTLSNQQLFWLKTFKDIGIPARVLRVKFKP